MSTMMSTMMSTTLWVALLVAACASSRPDVESKTWSENDSIDMKNSEMLTQIDTLPDDDWVEVATTCKGWCAKNAKDWDTKCTWNPCSGCDGCDGPAPPPPPSPLPPPSPPPPPIPSGPGLGPAQGMWRGASMSQPKGETNKWNVSVMEKSFGANIHIYRSFHGFKNKHSGILFEEERWQAARGGMVFYSTQPKEWAKVANGEFDDVLMGYAKNVKKLEPAQVIVAPGYEPDLYVADHAGASQIRGTPEDYKKMFVHYREVFAQQHVTNAKFVVDYSEVIKGKPELAEAFWPGDENVDWLMWNMFQWDEKMDCAETMDTVYQQFMDTASTKGIYNVPWGLGAWGTAATNFAQTKDVPEASRVACLAGVTEALDSGKYPMMKASIYFNSLYHIISTYDFTKTNNGVSYKASTSPEIVDAFKAYLNAESFKLADQYELAKCNECA